MKRKRILPDSSLSLISTNPVVQQSVIDLFKKAGIPVFCETTGFDSVYPVLVWEHGELGQSKVGRDIKVTFEELVDLFFIEKVVVEVGTYSAIVEDGDKIKVGCQTITFEQVENVYMAMKDLRD